MYVCTRLALYQNKAGKMTRVSIGSLTALACCSYAPNRNGYVRLTLVCLVLVELDRGLPFECFLISVP